MCYARAILTRYGPFIRIFKYFVICNLWGGSIIQNILTQIIARYQQHLDTFSGPVWQSGLNFISACIGIHIPSREWYQLTDPYPNFNCANIEVWEWISDLILHFIMDVITNVHIDKRGPMKFWCLIQKVWHYIHKYEHGSRFMSFVVLK